MVDPGNAEDVVELGHQIVHRRHHGAGGVAARIAARCRDAAACAAAMTVPMLKVPEAEAARNFSHYRDKALTQQVAVTSDGEPRLVLISIEEYERLKKRDRQALRVEEHRRGDGADHGCRTAARSGDA